MKNISCFLLLALLLISNNIVMSQNFEDSLVNISNTKKEGPIIIPKYDSIIKEYTVNEIKKIDKAYIIEIEDIEGYIFAIISLKCEKYKREKIRKGRKYNFLLYAYDDPKKISMQAFGHGLRRVIFVEKTFISLDYDLTIGILVTTPNLKGLYYIKP